MRHKLKNYSLFTQAVQWKEDEYIPNVKLSVFHFCLYTWSKLVAPRGCAIVHERAPKYFTHLRPYLVVLHRFTEFLLALRRGCRSYLNLLPPTVSSSRTWKRLTDSPTRLSEHLLVHDYL